MSNRAMMIVANNIGHGAKLRAIVPIVRFHKS